MTGTSETACKPAIRYNPLRSPQIPSFLVDLCGFAMSQNHPYGKPNKHDCSNPKSYPCEFPRTPRTTIPRPRLMIGTIITVSVSVITIVIIRQRAHAARDASGHALACAREPGAASWLGLDSATSGPVRPISVLRFWISNSNSNNSRTVV